MGLLLSTLALLALLAGAATLVRRSRRREAELEAELLEALHDASSAHPALEVTIDSEVLRVGAPGGAQPLVELPRRRLEYAVRRGHAARAIATAALDFLARPPRPLKGSFSLKIHGPRVRARMTTSTAMALRPAEPRPAHKSLEDLQLVVTYWVGERFVTEDHLRQQGIDTRDLHGIALAVERQELDEKLSRRALASGPGSPSPEILRSADGAAGAALLTLADTLNPGEALAARLVGPDWLALAPLGYLWPASVDTPETRAIHPAVDLVIEPGGYRIR